MSAKHLYEFGEAFEEPTSKILVAAGFTSYTPMLAASVQKKRPRSELVFQLGVEKKSYHQITRASGIVELRNASWFAQLMVFIITEAAQDVNHSAIIHREYRSQVLAIFATLKDALNGNDAAGLQYLPYHQVQLITQTSNVVNYKPQDNQEISRINFSLEFGIRYSAWAELDIDN